VQGKILSDGGAREPAEQESAKTELGNSSDRGASANGRRGPVCGAGRKPPLGGIQAASPAAERGGIGQAIGVFKRRCCFFPGAVLLEAPPQGLTASQEAVVRVGEREGRKEGERFPAIRAAATADLDPVVIRIVRLLAAASMANDRIPFTNGTSPHDDVGALFGPVGFQLARPAAKWDKENRNASGLTLLGYRF